MSVSGPLVFAHIGDLHITKAKEQNYIDYLSILAQIQTECSEQLDFVFLPGDIADNGLPEQYKLVATGLKMLSVPAHVIAGDHDMEQGSLDNFYKYLQAEKLPKTCTIKGIKCIFLDVCGPGKGGPDFRLGDAQLNWLKEEVENTPERIVLFMHTYPDDLVEDSEKMALNELIAKHNVLLVDMGHTHYNDIANDGHVLFSATRSTGQIEEGPVGYSLISIDEDLVSWRFKPLAEPFPYVMITSPADCRLIRDDRQLNLKEAEIRAIVLGDRPVNDVSFKLGSGEWLPMKGSGIAKIWTAKIEVPDAGINLLTVQATDETGRPGQHNIKFETKPCGAKYRIKNGSDADSIGAWPENGIFGTQLGPNRNGKPSK